jgi:hypothetical protein
MALWVWEDFTELKEAHKKLLFECDGPTGLRAMNNFMRASLNDQRK